MTHLMYKAGTTRQAKLGIDGAESATPLSRLELTIAKHVRGTGYAALLTLLSNLFDRCIPKMDHHCPWTINCVSHRTFPHYYRFLLYSAAAMIYLEYFVLIRAAYLWEGRYRPSVIRVGTFCRASRLILDSQYLGPTPVQLISLFVLLVVNTMTLFAIGLLLARNTWSLGANVTTIESWEIERHKTLVRRAKGRGGYLDGPDGIIVKLIKQEFPYDIGIAKNVSQGMGGSPLFWFWPFAGSPSNCSGLAFETNDFEGTIARASTGPAAYSLLQIPLGPHRIPIKYQSARFLTTTR